MRTRESNALMFGGLLSLLLVANFGCSVNETGDGAIAGSTAPATQIMIFSQDSLGNTTGSSLDFAETGLPLNFQVTATPGNSAGFDFQNESSSNEIIQSNFGFFCDHQLGETSNLPGNPNGIFKDIPAFRRGSGQEPGNELEILRAISAALLDRTMMAIPEGFNLGVLFTPDTPDTRADATIVTLTFRGSRFQCLTVAGRYTFSATAVDKSNLAGTRRYVLQVSKNTGG